MNETEIDGLGRELEDAMAAAHATLEAALVEQLRKGRRLSRALLAVSVLCFVLLLGVLHLSEKLATARNEIAAKDTLIELNRIQMTETDALLKSILAGLDD